MSRQDRLPPVAAPTEFLTQWDHEVLPCTTRVQKQVLCLVHDFTLGRGESLGYSRDKRRDKSHPVSQGLAPTANACVCAHPLCRGEKSIQDSQFLLPSRRLKELGSLGKPPKPCSTLVRWSSALPRTKGLSLIPGTQRQFLGLMHSMRQVLTTAP